MKKGMLNSKVYDELIEHFQEEELKKADEILANNNVNLTKVIYDDYKN